MFSVAASPPKLEHTRQSRPDSGPGFQEKSLKILKGAPFAPGSDAAPSPCHFRRKCGCSTPPRPPAGPCMSPARRRTSVWRVSGLTLQGPARMCEATTTAYDARESPTESHVSPKCNIHEEQMFRLQHPCAGPCMSPARRRTSV